jgi:prepilin peptidase CpaA
MIATLLHTAIFSLFIGLMVWAAASDFRAFRIPNIVCAAIVILYPLYVAASTAPIDWIGGIVVAGVLLVIGLPLFALGWMGGGDVKLIAAVGLWAGPPLVGAYVVVTAIAGGLLSFAYLIHARGLFAEPAGANRAAPRATQGPKPEIRVPYGVAIAVGGLSVAGLLLTETGV